ncbi:hypothetical protein AVEN_247229-1 [Araneus ventricosus]|uniref:Uncharacterized protein n=1 Tax=Araneus ventricosus TaxID=182803 RepID=A0A4Y2ET84_ARAVE|nr:hypothetical protein AVEN_247229-1 [Araneus ventricosus]
MLPAGGAVRCSRRTESENGCKQSIASNRCNRNTIDSRCAPFAAQRWCIPRMKFSVILCSMSTKKQAHAKQFNSSSSCSIAGLSGKQYASLCPTRRSRRE